MKYVGIEAKIIIGTFFFLRICYFSEPFLCYFWGVGTGNTDDRGSDATGACEREGEAEAEKLFLDSILE